MKYYTKCRECGGNLGYSFSQKMGICGGCIIPSHIPYEQREKYIKNLIKKYNIRVGYLDIDADYMRRFITFR